MSRPHDTLDKSSLSSKILKYALRYPGKTSKEIATSLKLPQAVVSTALIVHVKRGRLSRSGEKYRYCYGRPGKGSDKGSTDGGGA